MLQQIPSPDRLGQPRPVIFTRKRLYVAWFAVAMATTMSGCLPDPPASQDPTIVYTAEDLSAFEHFTFYRTGGEGFCPPVEAVFRADLQRQPDGGVTLDMWILEPGIDPMTAPCMYGSGPAAEMADCLGQRLPTRALTAVEIDRVHEVFQSVMIGNVVRSASDRSECQLFDPCRLDYANWDGRVLGTDTPCHPANQVSREQMDAIIKLLESLRLTSCSRSLTEQDAGSTVELRVGDCFQVALADNPTTGFGWDVEFLDMTILGETGSVYSPDEAPPGWAGTGGTLTMRFHAIGAGETTLRLIYHRSFEPDTPPAQTFEVTVKVSSAE